MACRLFRALPLLIGVIAPGLLMAQAGTGSARSILRRSTADQITFVETTVDQGFPEHRVDELTMLVINRSDIAVPTILRKLEDVLDSQTAPARIVDTAVEMIAYAGDEQAIRAIGQLLSVDEKRFGPYIGRTLDNAGNWRNPFGVAYRALEMSDRRIIGPTMNWVEAGMDSRGRQRQWAEAILDRYGKVPATSEWANDPIASRLDQASALGSRVLSVASEVQRNRSQRQ
jgi:hypothetical protein